MKVKRKKGKKDAFCRTMSGAYPTLENFVYLGKCSPYVRRRAERAGLVPLAKLDFIKLYQAKTNIQKIVYQGTWHDTVVY